MLLITLDFLTGQKMKTDNLDAALDQLRRATVSVKDSKTYYFIDHNIEDNQYNIYSAVIKRVNGERSFRCFFNWVTSTYSLDDAKKIRDILQEHHAE